MDYFTELLESFNRLKKRTFKLEYISESDSKRLVEYKMGDSLDPKSPAAKTRKKEHERKDKKIKEKECR